MKYLIINGSPHRGNTWTVVQAAMKKIKELDANYTAEEIHLMPHQKLVGAMFYCLGKISSKHMVVTYKK